MLFRRIVSTHEARKGDEIDVVGFCGNAGAPAGIDRAINEQLVAVDGVLQGVELAVDVFAVVGAVLDQPRTSRGDISSQTGCRAIGIGRSCRALIPGSPGRVEPA